MKFSTNKSELLGVVWASEHFRNYHYGTEFQIVTYHKALLSALSAIQGKTTMHSRLTRWVNRRLFSNLKYHTSQETIWFFFYLLSRLPSGRALPTSYYDEEFVVVSTHKIQNILFNRTHFSSVDANIVDRPLVVVNTNTLVKSNIPSGVENSSDVIGQNFPNSSLANFKLQIIVAIIFCIARSIKICDYSHTRTQNCSSKCLHIDN